MKFGAAIVNKFIRQIAKFGGDRRGQVALTFGLAAIPMMGAAGIAVDFARKNDAQITTQSALDGAAMAATAAFNSGENESAYTAAAQKFFNKNKPDNLIGSPQVSIDIDVAAGTLTASTEAKIATTLTTILGYDNMPLISKNTQDGNGEDDEAGQSPRMETTVSLPAFTREHRGEIVFVMDYSGSMGWSLGGEKKYKTMRNEAAKLVNALSQAKTNQYVKFGVVPFSQEVFLTMKKKYWTGFTGNQMRSSCLRDRYYPYNLSDATPTSTAKTHNTKFGQVKKSREWVWIRGRWRRRWLPINSNPNSQLFYEGDYNYRYYCSAYSGWRHLEVQDLTDNHNDTYNKILSMSPYAGTHIALGMEFGYHLLSPNAPFTNGVAYNDDGTEKAVILLTDGQQTTKAFGNGGSYSERNGERNLASLCTNMKNSGIRILTISYDLNDADTENRLRQCATSNDDFYDADTKNELSAAFAGITAKLARDMFLSK
jgi:Flp pilus assembly protein TadG